MRQRPEEMSERVVTHVFRQQVGHEEPAAHQIGECGGDDRLGDTPALGYLGEHLAGSYTVRAHTPDQPGRVGRADPDPPRPGLARRVPPFVPPAGPAGGNLVAWGPGPP